MPGAPPPLLAQRRQQIAAAIMHCVMALCAKGYKIPALPRQIRVHPCRVAVVHSRRRAVLAIAQALLAQVAIAPQDARAQSRPSLVRINAGRHAGYHLRGDRQQKEPEPANALSCRLPAPALKALASRYVDYDLAFAVAAKHRDVDALGVASDLRQPSIAVAYRADEISRPYG